MKIKDLTSEQVVELRKQIVLNSLYISDYENSFGIDPNAVCTFFDSYLEDCEYIPNENGDLLCDLDLSGDDYYDKLFEIANNNENLINYFESIEWES